VREGQAGLHPVEREHRRARGQAGGAAEGDQREQLAALSRQHFQYTARRNGGGGRSNLQYKGVAIIENSLLRTTYLPG